MSIATLDAALAGMQAPQFFTKALTGVLVSGQPRSLAYLAGAPGARPAPANTAGGVTLSSSSAIPSGIIPHYDPGSGNSYLAKFLGNCSQPGTLLLLDRLIEVWGNSGGSALSVTSTSAQTINSTTLPARDRTGTTNGDAVLWALEVSSAMGAGTPTLTLGYTNQAGTASRTATNADAVTATSAAGTFYRFGLQAGDTGIQSVQSLTLSATMTSGTFGLVGYRLLNAISVAQASVSSDVDALTSGFPQIYNGSCPFLVFIPNATNTATVCGTYAETQG